MYIVFPPYLYSLISDVSFFSSIIFKTSCSTLSERRIFLSTFTSCFFEKNSILLFFVLFFIYIIYFFPYCHRSPKHHIKIFGIEILNCNGVSKFINFFIVYILFFLFIDVKIFYEFHLRWRKETTAALA